MIPIGYMAKRISSRPEWLHAPHVVDVFSASGCVSENFADYINYWKHNGYWFFDNPEIIKSIAHQNSLALRGTTLFYYEGHEEEFDDGIWRPYGAEASFRTNVLLPINKQLEGFDVVSFPSRTSAGCSPLSCNSLAEQIPTNVHCLLASFEEAKAHISEGKFAESEPPPFRIFAVYSIGDWL